MNAIPIDQNLTIECVGALRERLGQALANANGDAALTLALGQVAEFDAAGLQLLLAFGQAATRAGLGVTLHHPPALVTALLAQYGLAARFTCEARP